MLKEQTISSTYCCILIEFYVLRNLVGYLEVENVAAERSDGGVHTVRLVGAIG